MKPFHAEHLQQLLENPEEVLTTEHGAMQMFVAGTLHTARAADALERIAHTLESGEIALLDREDLTNAVRGLRHGSSY